MCKTKTLIYTFTNRAALDECLEDISRNYADKEISHVSINFIGQYVNNRDNLTYDELIGWTNTLHSKNIIIDHSATIEEIRALTKNAQNIIGELMVEL